MKRVSILFALIIIASFIAPAGITNNMHKSTEQDWRDVNPIESVSTASASGGGQIRSAVAYMTRTVSSQSLKILNSYNTPNEHKGQLDLTDYLIDNWDLFNATLEINSISATAEHKTLGINRNNYINTQNSSGLITDALYQEFYKQPHDGRLENYTFAYSANPYDMSLGDAFLVVRSNYSDKQTNVTGWITPFTQTLGYTSVTHNCAADDAILDAGTSYYVVIDGTAMIGQYVFPPGTWTFNTIYWRARYPYLGLETGYHLRDVPPPGDWDVYDAGQMREAELNYTYTPWNKTANAALTYVNAEQISLTGNGTSQSGTTWEFSLGNNIEIINFQSNQSVVIDYDLTLLYQRNDSSPTSWRVATSGNTVHWNVSLLLAYPSLSGTILRNVSVTVQPDWFPTGLYNGTSTDYGHYNKIGSIVYCTDMTNGTWILTNSADNYVTSIELSNHADASTVQGKVNISVDVDIDISVEDGIGTPMNTGMTNLTIWYGGSVIYAPSNVSVSGGAVNYLWDIDSIADYNGTHTIEVFWTNGLEAGYLVSQIFVYYPTTLVTDDNFIQAYTDNTFYVGIDFNQIYPVRSLDSSLASVTYSFGAEVNQSMIDQGGGRWDRTISTAGLSSGVYLLYIYAEGYALENKSLTIPVDLTYETLPLNWSWSQGSNITYLESTNFTISYRLINGTNIPGATVNVTFDGYTYDMTWDPIAEVYWIQLNGSDFATIPGNTTLIVNASKFGYAPQYNDSIEITISAELGVYFDIVWNPIDRNITYIEQVTITVNYTFNSVPIDDTWEGVWVRVTFVGYPYVNLTYNPVLEVWQVTLDGSDYLGTTTVTVRASATGYSPVQNVFDMIVMEDIPSLSSSWTANSYTTDYVTGAPLTITVQDSIGSTLADANLTITVNGVVTTYTPGEYSITIAPPQTAGIYSVNVTMGRYGYVTTSIFLSLTVRATTAILVDTVSNEYEQWNITVTVTYSDTLHSTPITGATVTMTLDGVDYALVYTGGIYVIEIVLDVAPGTYTISVTATEQLANPAADTVELTVNNKLAVHLELRYEGNPSLEGQLVSLIATLAYNDTEQAVIGELVHFVVTITFANGTVQIMDRPNQYDTTNTDGIAQWSFYVPGGNIESIEAEAHYYGSRILWSTQKTITVGGTSPIIAVLFFFFGTTMGQLVVGSIAIVGIVAAAYNRRVKPKKRAALTSLENQLQMFIDLESLRHFMAVYLDRGTCVFYHPFTDERIQPDLISGFIAAITSVYGEIKGDGVRGTLEEIQYHGLRLNSYSGEKIIGILILEGEMTPLLKDRLQFFVELFENQYEKDLEGWSGLVDCFDSEWIVSTLNSAFNYAWLLPHRFGPTQKVSKTDARILDYIGAVRDERGEFYLRQLLSPLAEMLELSQARVLDRLLTLQDRGAIVPVGVQTVLQRQGMGLSNGQEGEDIISVTLPRPSETAEEKEEEPAKVEQPKAKPEEDIEEPTPKKIEKPKPKAAAEEPAKEAEEVAEKPAPKPIDKAKLKVMAEEPAPKPEPKEEIDSMEAFVRDVESLLVKEKKESETDEEEEK